MLPRAIRAAAAALLLGLAGCVGPAGPPWALAASPSEITLRWYPDDTSETEALEVADAHCAATGRSAGIAAAEEDGSAEVASYRCR